TSFFVEYQSAHVARNRKSVNVATSVSVTLRLYPQMGGQYSVLSDAASAWAQYSAGRIRKVQTRTPAKPPCTARSSELRALYPIAPPIIVRSAIVGHFASGPPTQFWPKADIPSCTAHVRFRG